MSRLPTRSIARRGADALYSGPLAQAIVDTVQHPPLRPGSTRSVRPGVMQLSDLAAYEAVDRERDISYRGYGMAPPSSGGSTVGEILNILEGYRALPREQALHYYLEASRLAYADRACSWPIRLRERSPGAAASDQFAAQGGSQFGERAVVDPAVPRAVTDTSASAHARRLDDQPDRERPCRCRRSARW